jgi:C1A family cysteine protease
MKILFVSILIAAVSCELLVTPAFTEALRNRVNWEVVPFEENVFRGWTVEEFREILGDEESTYVPNARKVEMDSAKLPSEVNWAGADCIHEIHNQGSCGSCWAFATASVVSDLCCMQEKDHGWLSPQELVSCDKANSGCQGGLAAKALEYVKANGLVPETCYPYTAKVLPCPNKCADGGDWKAAHVCKAKDLINCGTLEGMKKCIVNGPITVRMIVYQDFMAYKGGVYCWDKKSSALGGHAIRAVGYSDTPEPNFNCANSWGPAWGEKGYFRISPKDNCGLRTTPNDAWAAKF